MTRCGVYLASCQLMDMADTEQQVEVFYIVRKIRKVRSEFIMSLVGAQPVLFSTL